MSVGWLLLQFAVCAVLIGRAGYLLSRSGDRLADALGWGRSWVGLALLATVTSIPELASGITAVAVVGAPNLALGDALGSCVFNLAFLVVIDALQRGEPMYRHASGTHMLSAAFGVVLLGFVAAGLLVARRAPDLLYLGFYGPVLLGLYLLALASVHSHDRVMRAAAAAAEAAAQVCAAAPPGPERLREWQRFALAALVVAGAGIWLPHIADKLSQALGLSRSMVGTLFMALATSLPEMAVTLAALRMRALDLAIGNLLGSNLFNTAVLVVDDAFYAQGSLLRDAEPVHALTAISAMVMSALVMVGLVMRPQGRVLRTASWVSLSLVAAYLLNAALLFVLGGA